MGAVQMGQGSDGGGGSRSEQCASIKRGGSKEREASLPSGAWHIHGHQIGLPHGLISVSPQTASTAGIKRRKKSMQEAARVHRVCSELLPQADRNQYINRKCSLAVKWVEKPMSSCFKMDGQ